MPALFPVEHVDQIALVVRDLDQAMRRYWELLGVGPWRVYTYGPPLVRDMTYRGRRQDYRMRLALAHAGQTMVELIQPLAGPNVYDEHLERKGEGLHHIGVFVPSFDEAVAEVKQRGYAVLQSGRGYGRLGDGGGRTSWGRRCTGRWCWRTGWRRATGSAAAASSPGWASAGRRRNSKRPASRPGGAARGCPSSSRRCGRRGGRTRCASRAGTTGFRRRRSIRSRCSRGGRA